jgi:hypothetical protein
MLGDTLGLCWGIGGELIGNFDENTLGTKKFKKIPTSPPYPKENNLALGYMLTHLIGCQEFLCLHMFFRTFGLGSRQGQN